MQEDDLCHHLVSPSDCDAKMSSSHSKPRCATAEPRPAVPRAAGGAIPGEVVGDRDFSFDADDAAADFLAASGAEGEVWAAAAFEDAAGALVDTGRQDWCAPPTHPCLAASLRRSTAAPPSPRLPCN